MLMKIRETIKGKEQGFTLIELIVVLAILAVLALLAVPRFASILEQSRLKTHNQNIEQIGAAIELYAADHPSVAGLTMGNLVTGNYLKADPAVPYDNTLHYVLADGANAGELTVTPAYADQDAAGNFIVPAAASTSLVFPTVFRP